MIISKNPNFKISKQELKQLFYFATKQTHFIFNNEYYDQVDGVAMGSPLAPVLANLFMGYHECNWLSKYSGTGPKFYKRYVDDVFAAFNNEIEAERFFDYLNQQHNNIKFTMEKRVEDKISFLDINISNFEQLKTSVFRKSTFTGILTNFNSFTPFTYKVGMIRCLIDRAYKINNSLEGFHIDLTGIYKILDLNQYPKKLYESITKTYLDNKDKSTNKNIQANNLSQDTIANSHNDNMNNMSLQDSTNFFKLPYLGNQSTNLKRKVFNICKKFCHKSKVKLVFTSCKIKQFFSAKDQIPLKLKSNLVYKFECAGCNACYIGETTRHFSKRIDEHLRTDKNSAIYKHLFTDTNCLDNSSADCFSIIDMATSRYQLKIKEGMHITWENPSLNKQVKYESTHLTL